MTCRVLSGERKDLQRPRNLHGGHQYRCCALLLQFQQQGSGLLEGRRPLHDRDLHDRGYRGGVPDRCDHVKAGMQDDV